MSGPWSGIHLHEKVKENVSEKTNKGNFFFLEKANEGKCFRKDQ